MSELISIAVLLGVATVGWRVRPRRLGVVAVFGGLAALMLARLVSQALAWLSSTGLVALVGPLVVLVAAGAGVGWYRFAHSRTVVNRWGRSVRRKSGVASAVDIARVGSGVAMRRQAVTVRPSLGDLTWWERLRRPVTEVAVPLCRAGLLRVWSSIEDVVLVFGGPRFGKSGWLGGQILAAPGAVIVTSTKPDLYTATARLRAHRGPVHVFNPTGVGGIASTMGFNPVTGCENALTAAERAEDMLPGGSGDTERDYWVGQARQVLAAFLHAAALGELSCQDIAEWIADPDRCRGVVLELLVESTDTTGAYATAAAQFFTTNPRTRSSITASIRPALNWLISPHARAAASGHTQFNVAELLRTRATLYLLGSEQAHTASLVAALTGHIAREAKLIASRQPGGRLDPALMLALDEAALICPIPLQRWSADMGSHGIQIIASFQSRAQLFNKWGIAGAAELINNAGSIMLFGGTNDEDDLRAWSTLFGHRDEEVVTTDQHGRVTGRSVRQVPVFSPAQLSNLPKFRVVVKRRYMAPVIGRAPMFWHRTDVRGLARATRKTERAVLVAARRAARLTWTAILTTAAQRVGLGQLRRDRTVARQARAAQRRGQGHL
jgi:hypothetical protein